MIKLISTSLLLLSSSVVAQDYQLPLPRELPINQIEQWIENIAIADQVCSQLPDYCLSALNDKSLVITETNPHKLFVNEDGAVYVHKTISVKGIQPTQLKSVPINYQLLQAQLNSVVLPSDHQRIVQSYLSSTY